MSADIMQQNNKPHLIIGDLGSGSNIVKNLMLLDKKYKFAPDVSDRHAEIMRLYPQELKHNLSGWFKYEYKLRNWKRFYGIDLSDYIDAQEVLHVVNKIDNVIFINHSAFYQKDVLLKIKDYFNITYVCPKTLDGLKWQIKMYVEKCSIDNLHNFSTETDDEKKDIIAKHGVEYWKHLNLANMFATCRQRRADFYMFAKENSFNILALEMLYKPSKHTMLYNFLTDKTGYNVNNDKFNELLNAWLSLHDDYTLTSQWEWFTKIDNV